MPHPAAKGLRATLLGILANLFLAALKATVGFVGNSYALIADAIESTMDVFTSLVTWLGLKAATKAPDDNHPYGHGKAEPLAGVVVAASLVVAAILIAIQSIQHILTPHKIPAPFTLWVLAGVVIVKEGLFRWVIRIGDEMNSTAVRVDAWHHRSDAITSLTAFVGISIAIWGGEGYESADDWAALLASAIICYNAYHLFLPAFNEVMDAAPPSDLGKEVREIALRVDGVKAIDKTFVRKMGFEYFIDLHIVVDGNLTVREGHRIAHAVKDQIRQDKPSVFDVLIHVEPMSMDS
ncbi:MAG: cation transporter [Ferruginibacter sp.]|nr:cation transporter [Cytophagales bacterium]